MNEIIFDVEVAGQAKSIMGDQFPLMVEYYIEDSIGYFDKINKAMSSNDVKLLIYSSHTLKSSSCQLGLIKLSRISDNIENFAREIKEEFTINDNDFLRKSIINLEKTFKESKIMLLEFIN